MHRHDHKEDNAVFQSSAEPIGQDEAEAYCAWLTNHRLETTPGGFDEHLVRLAEAAIEKATAGGSPIVPAVWYYWLAGPANPSGRGGCEVWTTGSGEYLLCFES